MSSRYRSPAGAGLVLFVGLLAACSGGDSVSPSETYRVGGTVSGLQTGRLVLRNNGSDEVSLESDGSFSFPKGLPSGTVYTVVVGIQPPGQTCQVSGGTGTVGNSNVNDVVVVCQLDAFTIGGTVTGLDGGELVLRNNGGDDLTVNANGSFVFPTPLSVGSSYEVAVAKQPVGQLCALANAAGTVGDRDVTTVAVSCAPAGYAVGGTVTGLTGGPLVLQVNGGDDLEVNTDGSFAFETPLQTGTAYEVTVATQPDGQVCLVEGGSGTVEEADVVDVSVSCEAAYSVGGTITGLGSSPVVLQNNGSGDLAVSTDGSFTFDAQLADGSTYDVTISEQPADRLCDVTDGQGSVSGANVESILVTCGALPLSEKIVFQSDRDGDFEIYVMNPDGSGLVQLTDNDSADRGPAVSPDGRSIAFWSGRDGNQEIYVMDSDGSNPTRITMSGSADRWPTWSPDGQRLAFVRQANGTGEIYTIRVDGTDLTRLTNNTFDDDEPAWSPDGSLIAFMTRRDGNEEIYTIDASNGANPTNITNNPGRDNRPEWSPSGDRILFDRNNFYYGVDPTWQGDSEIMCMNADGSNQTRLTTDTSGFIDWQPRFSQSGDWVVFNSRRATNNPQLFLGLVNKNSCGSTMTNLTRLTNTASTDEAGDWSPQ